MAASGQWVETGQQSESQPVSILYTDCTMTVIVINVTVLLSLVIQLTTTDCS